MSIKLKLQPFSASITNTKSISFKLSNLKRDKSYRISFENATLNRAIRVVSSSNGTFAGDKIFIQNVEEVEGKIDLSLYESDAISVVSIYANIEEKNDSDIWKLSDIAAFSFQIENSKASGTEKVSVYPPFVGPEDKATVIVQTDPNSNLQVVINNKRFVVKANFSGQGSISFRPIDVFSGSPASASALQKYPVYYSKSKDNYTELYDSGVFVHFVPESMKALQATNDPGAPACAIIDPTPGQGLTINKLDDFCIDGSVVGPLSIFDTDSEDSNFYNSQVGFCEDIQKIYPVEDQESVCRIFNSTSSTILPNGSALVAFASQETFANDPYTIPTLSSRIFVAHIPTSLKYSGNLVRDGTVIKPPAFYHTATPLGISDGEKYSLTFRFEDGSLFEVQHETTSSSISEFVQYFVQTINDNETLSLEGVKAVDQGTFIELKSDFRFTIRTEVLSGDGTFTAKLRINKTLDIFTDSSAILDQGNTLVFLFPRLGYQSHTIVSRDTVNNIIRIEVPNGFNNDIGPNIVSNLYCQQFVIVDTETDQPVTDLVEVSPLPYIYDIFTREVSAIYPVITTRTLESTGETIAYVVCQSPVNGVYQLFYYSFRVGSAAETPGWKQLTSTKENKNARIKCDSIGNLHIVWESDRFGATQIYYGILGPSSRIINNQALISAIDKSSEATLSTPILSISTPTAIQSSWTRLITNAGKVSVPSTNKVVVDGNPFTDGAMALYRLTTDEFGKAFPHHFGQISFQVSFDFKVDGVTSSVLGEDDIKKEFEDWVGQFAPAGDNKYSRDNNLYTLDQYASYFDSMIPILGSYKIPSSSVNIVTGGATVTGYNNISGNTHGEMGSPATAAHPANIRHYMLAVMPEKIKFRAKNAEAYFQYCERVGANCDGYINEIEDIIYTGRFKLALVLATSENEGTGQVAKKQFSVTRLFGDFIDFRAFKNIKVAVHYAKMSLDQINGVLKRDKEVFENEIRFHSNIIVTVDNEAVLGQSFFADFTDQYGQFDIGLGMPYGDGFVTNESIPYQGNLYEDKKVRLIFNSVAIGPHSIRVNNNYVDVSSFDRNTKQMCVHENTSNILTNSSFDTSILPYAIETALFDGYAAVTDWTVINGAIYRKASGNYTASPYTGFRPTDGEAWIELTGRTSGATVFKGGISHTFQTSIGKSYYVSFDLSNNPNSYLQGSTVTKKVKVTAAAQSETFSTTLSSTVASSMNWKTQNFIFVATSSSTTLVFENASNQYGDSRDITYGPQIDRVLIVVGEDLNTEYASYSTAENLGIDQNEFDLNYSLNATDTFSQIPVTLSNTLSNKKADLCIDKIDKVHIAWQSNRNNYWDIYYAGSRIRNIPFRFETRITGANSNSINPSISVDSKGRRFIAWQDNRNGNFQIYSAVSKVQDDMLRDSCKQDEVDEFIYEWNSTLDPTIEPYTSSISQLNCGVEFEFIAPSTGSFHFHLLFYEDREYTSLYKAITSSDNLDGWRVNDEQLTYNGLSATQDASYAISYVPSYEDGLSGKVLYVVVQYQLNANPIDLSKSTNVQVVQPYSGLNLQTGHFEASTLVRAMLEFDDISPVSVRKQSASDLNVSPFTGMSFVSPLTRLSGVVKGDRVKSILLHFDPVGTSGTITAKVAFTSPIAAVFVSGSNLVLSQKYYGFPGVKYLETSAAGLEAFDTVSISADRKTLTVHMVVNPSVDEMRVLLEDDTTTIGENQFVYYCPTEQSSRCDANCLFVNNQSISKSAHFRVTFYADAQRTTPITSSFTKLDTFGWKAGPGSFPTNGITVLSGQRVNVAYIPEVLPFELYESQSKTEDSSTLRQPLVCGVTYHVTIESYVNDTFAVESQFEFLCPCNRTNVDFWNTDRDSQNWICSGQGFEDYRITETDNQCLFPIVNVTSFDMFYIVWQDFRFTRMLPTQPAVSPDYFVGLYDASEDVFKCSGQGGYDRRLTVFAEGGVGVLYDASVVIDPFQNINMIVHNGSDLYVQRCSFGCKISATNKDLILPCMFTDSTDSSFFVLPDSPDRDTGQYQKIRISNKYVAFSTYMDLQSPITVINDCFIELEVVGVPGTYAYRLKNENDEDWTEWLPIGPDLPAQTQTDTEASKPERDFFRAYFTERDKFVAPWVASAGNGSKRICCEILTFFGKTEAFCLDFMAIYNNLEYKVDLFFDEGFQNPVSKFKNYMVVSEFKTETPIDDSNLTSINEEVTKITTIYARVEFKDKQKIQLVEKLQNVERMGISNKITMSVYQQGINDQIGLQMTKIEDGIYKSSFTVEADDGVINIDGLAVIVIDVPGQCKPVTFADLSNRIGSILESRNLDQKVSVFNNFTVFREKYLADDIRGSFGSPDYYKIRTFGVGGKNAGNFDNTEWTGGGDGPLNNNTGYKAP